MTNHWADLANATLVVVWGANPSENHPASMAHINRARAGGLGHPKAELIVVDPRKTRTALQADKYIRIRPGTDIALINGLIKYIIDWMEANPADPISVKFFGYLNNNTATKTFQSNAGGTGTASITGWSKYTDAKLLVLGDDSDYVRATEGGVDLLPTRAADCRDADTVYSRLKAHVQAYTLAEVEAICGCSQADIAYLANAYINHGRCADTAALEANQDATVPTWRSTTMLYAMGITQHTCGSQNVKSFAVLQTLMGNMGRLGGGINALRGIHNVQGSTDMGVLRHLIPGYSGNPVTRRAADANAFGKYLDALWGNRLSGGTAAYDHAYTKTTTGAQGSQALQQAGFYNMTRAFFGNYSLGAQATAIATRRTEMDTLWDLWPKTNGDHHIEMFRKMTVADTGWNTRISAAYVLGQNPAVTEPYQSAVRDGLYNLELLVVQDMFETETAACDRKPTGVTYLIPSCSHVEKAGSATNSGRTLQWRYKAADPRGNTHADLELIMRLAKAFDNNGVFSHITSAWRTLNFRGWSATATGDAAYTVLYGEQYGFTPGIGNRIDSEVSAENVYKQFAANVLGTAGNAFANDGTEGTVWIYTNGYNSALNNSLPTLPDSAQTAASGKGDRLWKNANRAKSRDNTNYGGVFGYQRWGYAWLVNRRVLYNNGEIGKGGLPTGSLLDNSDGFQRPEGHASLFATGGPAGVTLIDYAVGNYRTYHKLADRPTVTQTGRRLGFPFHVEPYETPNDGATAGKTNYVAKYGRNSTTGTSENLIVTAAGWGATPRGTSDTYPLVLTSIRCVEHFQGGPITRNNGLNHEIEPEPWVEINSSDARKYGIVDGQKVRIVTARGDSNAGSTRMPAPPTSVGGFGGKNFTARVGVGLSSNQRVGPGVVAIPWHWGEKGLSTGARANDLCIDAFDANSQIPEYKACLCRIEPV